MSGVADNTFGLMLLGGSVVAASTLALRAWHQRSVVARPAWVHPVPSLNNGSRLAVVSNEYRARTSDNERTREHLGVDLMYRRRDARDLIAAFPVGTAGGTPLFFMPENIPALAASAGVVTFAGATAVGNTVIVRHPNGWSTYYTHLATLSVRPGSTVAVGQMIGTIGASPEDSAHLRHLHFELWKGTTRAPVDPSSYLAAWSRVRVENVEPVATLAHRNRATSSYRPVGDRGEPYPDWVRALKGRAGVYTIRDADTHEVLYVGSSAGRLYDTLTRHFQIWRRWKGYWKGQYGEGADPGLTYPRSKVEVAIRLTSPSDALDEEMRTIARLRPRDNQIGQPEAADEEVPF